MSLQAPHFEFRFIIVGDAAVGKSCFVQQFIDQSQNIRQSYDITIGVEFGIKKIRVGDKTIKIQIWDTAGQQNFKSITRSYFRGTIGAFIMYDITRRETFKHVELWLSDIKQTGNKYVSFYLIGNKNDLENRRQVSLQQGKQLAEKYQMKFVETNFKNFEQPEQSFKELAQLVIDKLEKEQIPLNLENIGVKIGDGANKQTLSKINKAPPRQYCC